MGRIVTSVGGQTGQCGEEGAGGKVESVGGAGVEDGERCGGRHCFVGLRGSQLDMWK